MQKTIVTLEEFTKKIQDGLIHPGDCGCVQNGERSWLNYPISYVQKTALRDLSSDFVEDDVTFAGGFTHIVSVISSTHLSELYYPKARLNLWSNFRGKAILFRRVLDPEPNMSSKIVQEALKDIASGEKYSIRELFYYYFRWARKATFHHKFADIFLKSKRYNVCSGQYIIQLRRAGAKDFLKEEPEAWYPARCVLTPKMKDIAYYEIKGE